MLLAQSDQMAGGGLHGRCITKLGAAARALCRKIVEGEPDQALRERYQNARCSTTMVYRVLRNTENSVSEEGTMKEQSYQSTARAKAKNPIFKDGFFAQIKETYARHYAEGILLTPEPDNDQCFGGDEVRSNPAGGKRGRKVFCSLLRK